MKLYLDIASLVIGLGFALAGILTNNWYYTGIGYIIVLLVTNTGSHKNE